MDISDHQAPVISHLQEMRTRLIKCLIFFLLAFSIAYIYSENIFQFLLSPLADILKEKGQGRRMIYTSLTEAFVTYLKVAAFTGAFIAFPLISIQIWRFVAPALYITEKKVFISLLIATPLMFLGGAAFAYFLVFPQAYHFFLSFEIPGASGQLPITLEAKVSEYLSFVMRLVFAFGICFELPIFMAILAKIGLIHSKLLKEYWRLAVVIIFAISAIITPPDIFSMIALALPLMALYGLSLGIVTLIEKRKDQLKC